MKPFQLGERKGTQPLLTAAENFGKPVPALPDELV